MSTCQAPAQTAPKKFEKLVEKYTPLGWLKWGLTTRKHERKGWLAETLIENGELIDGQDSLTYGKGYSVTTAVNRRILKA